MKRLSHSKFIKIDKKTSMIKFAATWLTHERVYNLQHGMVYIPVNPRFAKFLEDNKIF